jgi:hypothetical protein
MGLRVLLTLILSIVYSRNLNRSVYNPTQISKLVRQLLWMMLFLDSKHLLVTWACARRGPECRQSGFRFGTYTRTVASGRQYLILIDLQASGFPRGNRAVPQVHDRELNSDANHCGSLFGWSKLQEARRI